MNKYEEDLNFLLKELEKRHICFYFYHSKEEILELKNKLIKLYPLDNIYNLYYVANYIISVTLDKYDQHTKLLPFFKMLPININYIDGRLYIMNSTPTEAKLKYIKKINGIDINELLNEYKLIVPRSTPENYILNLRSSYNSILNMFILKTLPSIDKSCSEFEIELSDGSILKYNYKEKYPYPNKTNKENLSYEIIDNSIIKIHYDYCFDKSNAMQYLIYSLKSMNYTKYIIDIRGNPGGNSDTIEPLIEFLNNKDYQIVTLVDNCVFSAGRWAIESLKKIGSKFIGTKIGMPSNSFGNIGEPIYLPNSQLKLMYSTKYFPFTRNAPISIDNQEEFKKFNIPENQKFFIPFEFTPDIFCENSIEDIENNYDRVLNEGIKYLDKNYTQNEKIKM
jgi:hypothetical protein